MKLAFDTETFLAVFPAFSDEEKYPTATVFSYGVRAGFHIKRHVKDMPMCCEDRDYALFLMTAHLIALDDMAKDDDGLGGVNGAAMGAPFKATVGSVSVETTKQNSFASDDWNYWLNKTSYGQELLALLSVQAPVGVYLNGPKDSVRDLI